MNKITLNTDDFAKAIVMHSGYILQTIGINLTMDQIRVLKDGVKKDLENGKHLEGIRNYNELTLKTLN